MSLSIYAFKALKSDSKPNIALHKTLGKTFHFKKRTDLASIVDISKHT